MPATQVQGFLLGSDKMHNKWRDATTRGDIDKVRLFVCEGADVNAKDKFSQTALMYGSRVGNIDLVRLLVESGADLDITAKYNLSALMLAVINGHADVARFLIEAGADLTIRGGNGAIGFCGKTALVLAKERGQELVINLLQEAGATE